ncbi:MAG: alpha/beta hydrolase [Sorangiineae bacterium]|nr:alpha/beta hydrolase [Polyangiaceae bacterium]MEB2321566.1 alpha/beta hydrolase [Sorangiineae bacterium]
MSATPHAPRSLRLALETGLEAHVLEWGAESAALDHTVVLVHGFLDLAWGWEDTVTAGLAERFHVLAPDMRGHGDSARVGAGGYYHFMDYVADLASLIDALGRARVSLVGHSMGGSIAAYLAGAWPERVHRLALLEGLGPPVDELPEPERVARWIGEWRRARARAPRAYASLEAAAARLRENDPRLGPELALRLAAHGTRRDPDGLHRFKHDPLHLTRGPYPFRLDVAERFWRRVSCPVLLVEGSESPFRALAGLDERAACFSSVERVTLEGASHMVQRHRPAELASELARFLDGS